MKKSSCVAEIRVSFSHKIPQKERIQIKSSQDAYKVLKDVWDSDLIAYQEAFLVLLLNRSNRVLGYRFISTGGVSSTIVDAKHIFGLAVKCNASNIILAHNHPSSNTKPSQADLNLTRKLKKAGNLLDVEVLDHLIITPDLYYYSFADEGVL